MIFHDSEGALVDINHLKCDIPNKYIWNLDLKLLDFTLKKIKVIEEIVCNTVTLQINDRLIDVPAYWNILVCDPETTQLDAASVSTLSNSDFRALVYGPNMTHPELLPITVVDWTMDKVNRYPTHNRNFMMCHDIGDGKWISLSFSDSYNRFLKNKTSNDLVYY